MVHDDDSDDVRQPLSDVGGETTWRGDPAFAFVLAEAMRAQEGERDELTHGFHAYPARMHPLLARTVLTEMKNAARPLVLDPFVGSGTVLVEAMVAGWRSLGADLNPLAVRLARVKTDRRDARSRKRFEGTLREVARASTARVQKRVPIHARLPREELAWYEIHVLKELAGLYEEIRRVSNERDRKALEMVFSAIVVKVSRQRSETAAHTEAKRIRKGLSTEFFERKGAELVRRWAELDRGAAKGAQRPSIVQSDVKVLPHTLSGQYRCDLVLTSPPYGGTYDYVDHHARRMAWLGLATKKMRADELGARRDLSATTGEGKGAATTWDRQVKQMLSSMHELLRPDGVAVLLVGDGEVGGQRIDAAAQLERLGPEVGLEPVGVASQPRRDWKGGPGRTEHLVALLRPA